MRITNGELIENKTRKYLALILRDKSEWPDYLRNYLINNYVGFFRGDVEFNNATGNKNQNLLFVVVDINGEWVPQLGRYKSIAKGRRDYKNFLLQWRQKKTGGYKVWDYVINDLHKSNHHVFVLDISNFRKTVEAFDEGKYSEMFNDAELRKLGVTKTKNGQLSSLYATFKKLPEAKSLFQKRIEKEFGVIISDDNISELDIPPIRKQEYLNA